MSPEDAVVTRPNVCVPAKDPIATESDARWPDALPLPYWMLNVSSLTLIEVDLAGSNRAEDEVVQVEQEDEAVHKSDDPVSTMYCNDCPPIETDATYVLLSEASGWSEARRTVSGRVRARAKAGGGGAM